MANEQNAVPERDERRERMNRVRVGLTGLAVVLVLVFIATAIVTRISSNAIETPESRRANVQAAAETEGDEPLADLGVAPGATNDNAQANGAAGAVKN